MEKEALILLLEIGRGETGYQTVSEDGLVFPTVMERVSALKACLPYMIPKVMPEDKKASQGTLELLFEKYPEMVQR